MTFAPETPGHMLGNNRHADARFLQGKGKTAGSAIEKETGTGMSATLYWLKSCYNKTGGFAGSSVVKNPPANAGDMGSIPGLGRSPGGGRGKLLHYSCLENSMDRGAWWATVHGIAKSQTQLSTHATCLLKTVVFQLSAVLVVKLDVFIGSKKYTAILFRKTVWI